MKVAILTAMVLLLVSPSIAGHAQSVVPRVEATGPSSAVLVELFTSEGCSTCPPADKLLTELDQNQPVKGAEIIALSEHVDYWNRLGWKDPFSSAQFSQRQNDYSRALGLEDVYTPQMVVDGASAFIGSQRSLAFNTIAKAVYSAKAEVQMSLSKASHDSINLAIQVSSLPDLSKKDKADVMVAVTENGLRSNVSRGENKGKELGHSAVTRKLSKIATIEGKSFNGETVLRLEPLWKRENLRIVGFIQERESRRVLGAASMKP